MNNGRGYTHAQKTYVLLFLCLHFKRQKNTRTKEESITTGMRTHKKTYVLMFLCLHFKRQKNTRTKEE